MKISNASIRISVVIVAFILSIAALQASRPITMPLAFAFFIAILIHPLQAFLDKHLPKWLSLIVVLLCLAGVFSIFLGAIELSAEIIEPKVPEYAQKFRLWFETTISWVQERGFPVSAESFQSQRAIQQFVQQFVQQTLGGVRSLLSAISLLVLVAALLALLLLEANQYPRKIRQGFPPEVGQKFIHATTRMSKKLRYFLYVMSFTSFLTGVLTWAWCAILSVELGVVWGLLAFVLNFIPTIGSIIAVIPPTLVALAFGGAGKAIATLMGLAIMQNIMGNFVDPKLQGSSLNISSFVALTSTVFWGWVWGIPGAFLGVPMTAAIIGVCDEFESTKGVAILLGKPENDKAKAHRHRNHG